jgi:hypothetical protein
MINLAKNQHQNLPFLVGRQEGEIVKFMSIQKTNLTIKKTVSSRDLGSRIFAESPFKKNET